MPSGRYSMLIDTLPMRFSRSISANRLFPLLCEAFSGAESSRTFTPSPSWTLRGFSVRFRFAQASFLVFRAGNKEAEPEVTEGSKGKVSLYGLLKFEAEPVPLEG